MIGKAEESTLNNLTMSVIFPQLKSFNCAEMNHFNESVIHTSIARRQTQDVARARQVLCH
jgi:hypothetical protein